MHWVYKNRKIKSNQMRENDDRIDRLNEEKTHNSVEKATLLF